MSRPKKSPEEVAAARRAILAAAARSFANRGFAATTMSDIAVAAQCSAPTLYAYFKGKRSILDALVVQVVAELNGLFDDDAPPDAGSSFRDHLTLLLEHHFAWVERRKDAFLFLCNRAGYPSDVQDQGDLSGAHLNRLEAWIDLNLGPDERLRCSAKFAALIISGASNALFEDWVRTGAGTSLRDQAADLVGWVLDGVLLDADEGASADSSEP